MSLLWWILLLIVALVVGRRIYRWWRPTTHAFWDKQPVSRNYAQQGLISTTKQPALQPTDSTLRVDPLHLDTVRSREALSDFLRHHFIRGYHYSTDFLQWALGNVVGKATHRFNIAQNRSSYRGTDLAVRNTPLLGSISVKEMPLVIAGQPQRMGYVDYLAVHSGHRNKRLAPTLISQVTALKNYDSYIFKIEDTPLPFETTCSFRYYSYFQDKTSPIYPIPDHLEVIALQEQHLDATRAFLAERSRGFTLYADYDEASFRYWFLPRLGVVSSWLLVEKTGHRTASEPGELRIHGFWSYYHYASESRLHKDPLSMCEVTIFVADSDYILTSSQRMLVQSYTDSIECLVCPDIGYNGDFLHLLPFIPNKPCHFQLYNYGVGRSLEPREVLFNPV